jgi:hypothetical protein
MKTNYKIAGSIARKSRDRAGSTPKFTPAITGRAFDAVAYAAVLEVLG